MHRFDYSFANNNVNIFYKYKPIKKDEHVKITKDYMVKN